MFRFFYIFNSYIIVTNCKNNIFLQKKNLNEDKLNKLRKEEIKFQVNKKSWLKNQFYQDELFFKGSYLVITSASN